MPGKVQSFRQLMERVFDEWREDITTWTRHDLPKLLVILVLAFILLQLLRLITKRVHAYSKQEDLPHAWRAQQLRTLAGVVQSIGTVVIYFVAMLQILPLFDVDVKPILASAGIVGLAVGFGAQTFVKDVINGFFILLENQYDIGDVVRIATVQGTVEMMTLRKTVLRDADGTVHNVPNGEIKVVSNLTRDWAQIALHMAVDYGEPSDKVVQVLQEAAAAAFNDPKIAGHMVAPPEVPGIERIRGREVDYLVTAKVKPGQQWRVSRELRRCLKDALAANQIQTTGPERVFIAGPGQCNPENRS